MFIMHVQVALNLPPVFIAALSMGTIAGFQMAITHPDRVRGLFLASHLCLPEVQTTHPSFSRLFVIYIFCDLIRIAAARNHGISAGDI